MPRTRKPAAPLMPDLWAILAEKPGSLGWCFGASNNIRFLLCSDDLESDGEGMRQHAQAIADQGNVTTHLARVAPKREILETFQPAFTAVPSKLKMVGRA